MYANKIVDFAQNAPFKCVRSFVIDNINYSYQTHKFLEYCKLSLAKKSYQCYQSRLKIFGEYLKIDLPVTEITRKMIVNYTMYLAKKEYSKQYIKSHVIAINCFFNYLIENEITETSPAAKIKSIGIVKDCAPAPFTKNDIEKLRNYLSEHNPTVWLAAQFLYYCAIRPGTELRLLKISDIDFENGIIQIKSHNAKNRTTENIVCPQILLQQLIDLKYHKEKPDYFIFGKKGKPGQVAVSMNYFNKTFCTARRKLGISEQCKFYSFKHTGIITALQNGMHPFDVMAHCRHKKFETTENYIKKRTKIAKDNSQYFDTI